MQKKSRSAIDLSHDEYVQEISINIDPALRFDASKINDRSRVQEELSGITDVCRQLISTAELCYKDLADNYNIKPAKMKRIGYVGLVAEKEDWESISQAAEAYIRSKTE